MRSNRRVSSLLLAILAEAVGTLASGQTADRIPDSPNFGTTAIVQHPIPYTEFVPPDGNTPYSLTASPSSSGRYSSSLNNFYAIPHLPSGAQLVSFELDFCDTAVAAHVDLAIADCDLFGGNCTSLGTTIVSAPPGGSGCGSITHDLSAANYTVHNHARRILLVATLASGSQTNILLGAFIGYRLQVSPAPATATFSDVPTTSPQFKFVEALVSAGITAGCGGGNYCPNTPITRGQMAVFLASSLGLHFPN